MVDRCIGTQAGRLLNNYIQFDLGEMIDGPATAMGGFVYKYNKHCL